MVSFVPQWGQMVVLPLCRVSVHWCPHSKQVCSPFVLRLAICSKRCVYAHCSCLSVMVGSWGANYATCFCNLFLCFIFFSPIVSVSTFGLPFTRHGIHIHSQTNTPRQRVRPHTCHNRNIVLQTRIVRVPYLLFPLQTLLCSHICLQKRN